MRLSPDDLTPVDDPDVVGDLRSWDGVDLPGLARAADIAVWLPRGYDDSDERYPVIYMHDGGNAFLRSRSYGGATWEVGEAMSALAARGFPAIVVAVPCHPEQRGEEYSQYPHPSLGGGRAEDYATFLVNHLKPAVDDALRTRQDPGSAIVLGSSLGGVVSAYLWQTRPDVFGGAGLFSPAFWWPGEQALVDLEESMRLRRKGARVYVDVGGREEPGEPDIEAAYVRDAERVVRGLREAQIPVRYVFDSAAIHFETDWAARFPAAVEWLLHGWDR
ncbi:MAG TPA: alpha/beta hydrolase [Intrasporangiaceae bacterium]|nr:alpha/beta hydrolase [Intrasporangiaceae bacterium]